MHAVFLGLDELPLVGDDAYAPPVNFGITGYDGFAVVFFVFREAPCVDQCRNQLPRLVGLSPFGWKDGADIRAVGIDCTVPCNPGCLRWLFQVADDAPDFLQGILVIITHVIGHAADAAVGLSAAKGFVVDVLANGGFDQVTPREENGACVSDDQGFVAHNGQVRSAGYTGPHDGCNLWNAHG